LIRSIVSNDYYPLTILSQPAMRNEGVAAAVSGPPGYYQTSPKSLLNAMLIMDFDHPVLFFILKSAKLVDKLIVNAAAKNIPVHQSTSVEETRTPNTVSTRK
jgi:hypothetical protein